MPGFESVAMDLSGGFATYWASEEPSVPLFQENAKQPETPLPTGAWIRLSIRVVSSYMPELGSRLTENVGRVTVQVFTPQGEQIGRARELVDKIRNYFQGVRIGDARCLETELTVVGPDPAGEPYWQENVSTRFMFESMPA
jgi:hypothetical protein